MARKLRLTQVRSVVRALGLRRIRHSVVKDDRPEVRGMAAKVSHLVTMEEIDE